MQLQKLVYIAYGWTLALLEERLFKERIEAWEHGPVIPELYHEFKRFGPKAITQFSGYYDFEKKTYIIPKVNPEDEPVVAILDMVWERYGAMTATELRGRTHESGSPWDETYHGAGMNHRIPDDLIREHTRALITERWGNVAAT